VALTPAATSSKAIQACFQTFAQAWLCCESRSKLPGRITLGCGLQIVFWSVQDVARDVTSQEVVAKEVTAFMTNIGSVRVSNCCIADRFCLRLILSQTTGTPGFPSCKRSFMLCGGCSLLLGNARAVVADMSPCILHPPP
jgi:hypothetical protein